MSHMNNQAKKALYKTMIKALKQVIQGLERLIDNLSVPTPPKDQELLARTIWGEARGEGVKGMQAVAEVIINRQNKNRFPDTIEEVVKQPWQFSVWNESDVNKNKALQVDKSNDMYKKALLIAEKVLHNQHEPLVGEADHYHATYVTPSWADPNKTVAQIGNHIFYNLG